MRKVLLLAIAVLLTTVGVAGAKSTDQGRRLTGPFCINKKTGVVRSVAVLRTGKCRRGEVRRYGVAVLPGKGSKGEAGPIGPAGPAGPAGATGSTGATGAQGAAGATGAAGAQGPAGPAGQDGADGLPGLPGINNVTSFTGEDCSGWLFDLNTVEQGNIFVPVCNGNDGADGADGAAGPAGADGASGPAGPKGDTGATGPAGPAGADGADGAAGATGATGPAGPKGDTGATGAAGAAGPAGPAGAAGLDGSSIVTVEQDGTSGQKTTIVSCPAGHFAISGGFSAQGSVTESYRSNSAGNPSGANAWTVTQSSGNTDSLKVYVYCVSSS